MRWRQAENRVALGNCGERFFSGTAQAVLVAPGGEGKPCGRAHRRVGVAVGEIQTLAREAVEVGRDAAGKVRVGRCYARAAAAEVGVA